MLTTFLLLFYVISFILLYQNPDMTGQKRFVVDVCFLNKRVLQLKV